VSAFLARLAFWALVASAAGAVVVAAVWSAQHTLLSGNPHFTLRQFEVTVTGQLARPEVLTMLAQYGVEADATNLFDIDLHRLRADLLNDESGLIDDATVSRRLPDTLVVAIYERQPVAQLIKQRGKLIDSDGWILPPRYDATSLGLPVITGIKSARELTEGQQTDDTLVIAALELLHLCAVKPYGPWFDIALINLDYAREARLHVYLRERGIFSDRARIILPAEGLEDAMSKVEDITRERTRARQPTSFIDATYEVNIPVRG